MTSLDSTYSKPFLSVPEQIFRMRDRGMDCGSDEFAASVLERCGYYRLSGYSHPHRKRPAQPSARIDAQGREIRLNEFEAGTTLAHVVAMYDFDQELRGKVNEVLSTIEISFRFFIGHRLGSADAFAHRRPVVLDALNESTTSPKNSYLEWIEEYERQERRARDHFVVHFRENYGNHLPIWVATEVMGFGVLSGLYKLMHEADQKDLAARFQVRAQEGRGDSVTLRNWLNNLRHVRNICAHYGRLWNRSFDVLIQAPAEASSDSLAHLDCLADTHVNNRLYGVLVIMRHLLLSIDPTRHDVIKIIDFVASRSQAIKFDLSEMGFPQNWRDEPLWKESFCLSPIPMRAASLLDRTRCLTGSQTRKILTKAKAKPANTPRTVGQEVRAHHAAQRMLLKTYRSYNVVIEIELGGVSYYPEFQFRNGAIIDALAEINKTLTERCGGTDSTQIARALLDWWQAPHDALHSTDGDSAISPIDLLNSVSESEFTSVISRSSALATFVAPGRQNMRTPFLYKLRHSLSAILSTLRRNPGGSA